MKIESASVQLQSSHAETRRVELSQRLQAWVQRTEDEGDRRPPGKPTVTISDAAASAQQAEAVADGDSATQDPHVSLMIRIIEYFTGKPVKLLRLSELGTTQRPPSTDGNNTPPDAVRSGFTYDLEARYSESEATSFAASGVVRTTDGKEIAFDLALSMSRSYSESMSVSIRAGEARLKDPLILDFAGSSAQLSDLRFSFDLDADGTLDEVPLTGGKGLLAFDRNGNGVIDDGTELFGARTGDGFAELAEFDADGNGWIDENDPIFSKLTVWTPGASGAGTLQTLAEAHVGALYLGRVDTAFALKNASNETLGQMRSTSVYLREDGSVGTVSQVDLSV